MYDTTKHQQEQTPFLWKEYGVSLFIANIPASTIVVLLKLAGIKGALFPIVLIFGGAFIVGKYRRKKGMIATGKTLLYAIGANILFFVIIPMVLLALFA